MAELEFVLELPAAVELVHILIPVDSMSAIVERKGAEKRVLGGKRMHLEAW